MTMKHLKGVEYLAEPHQLKEFVDNAKLLIAHCAGLSLAAEKAMLE